MNKEEIVFMLKGHLRYAMRKKGHITKHDRFYCINYIMDFLLCDRKTAKAIYDNEIIIEFKNKKVKAV